MRRLENQDDRQYGSVEFVTADYMDLATVYSAAQRFLAREGPGGRLDARFNNVGTGAWTNPPATRQGHEYHFEVNSLGGYLLTWRLTPILTKTAEQAPRGFVRVVWPASIMTGLASPKTGIWKEFLKYHNTVTDENELYTTSKTANWSMASEFARRQPETGVLHVSGNLGQYMTDI